MHYLGTIEATYTELVELFGQPTSKGDGYKSEAQWDVKLVAGHKPVQIYNYKTSRSYDSANPSIYEVKEWSVQGHDSGAMDWLRGMVEAIRDHLAAHPVIKFPFVKVQLTGQNGNAFSILGQCQRAAKQAGLDAISITQFYEEATAGDYDHLLTTCQRWFDCA